MTESDVREERKISLAVPLRVAAFAVLLFLTALNGLFNVLELAHGGKHALFLPPSTDRHADLIEAALSMPPFGPDFVYHRDEPYSNYYLPHNHYKGLEGLARGELSLLQVPPLILVLLIELKQVIMALGPVQVVHLYYIFVLGCVAFIVAKFPARFLETVFVFVALALSYPLLCILCRGNAGALICSVCLLFFIREAVVGRGAVLAGLLLAVACNCRPNAILFAPLLLTFGVRSGARGLIIFLLVGAAIFSTCELLTSHLYPGYNLEVARHALKIYYDKYVIGPEGSHFNNTAYGAVWPLIHLFHPAAAAKILKIIQLAFTAGALLLLGTAIFCYLRGRIDRYQYAFTLAAIYILGSTVLATYHLFFLAVFLLLIASRGYESKPSHAIIWIVSILLLAPKNYIYINHVSLEVILNPLLLVIALVLIWQRREPLPSPSLSR